MIRDLREYTRNTLARLIIGFLVLTFLVGVGLIYLFYGKGAALLGLACMMGGLLPVGLIVIFLGITDRLVKNRAKSVDH